jgi:hypothetical protein
MPDADSTQARVFVSYSRQDGATFAAELRNRLEKEDLSIWQDIVASEGGRDWWTQIEETIRYKALQHFVLVVTPASLASPVVRREIRLARQEGKTVCHPGVVCVPRGGEPQQGEPQRGEPQRGEPHRGAP